MPVVALMMSTLKWWWQHLLWRWKTAKWHQGSHSSCREVPGLITLCHCSCDRVDDKQWWRVGNTERQWSLVIVLHLLSCHFTTHKAASYCCINVHSLAAASPYQRSIGRNSVGSKRKKDYEIQDVKDAKQRNIRHIMVFFRSLVILFFFAALRLLKRCLIRFDSSFISKSLNLVSKIPFFISRLNADIGNSQ